MSWVLQTLQRTATYCNALQHTATNDKAEALLSHGMIHFLGRIATHYSTPRYAATHCIALQQKFAAVQYSGKN